MVDLSCTTRKFDGATPPNNPPGQRLSLAWTEFSSAARKKRADETLHHGRLPVPFGMGVATREKQREPCQEDDVIVKRFGSILQLGALCGAWLSAGCGAYTVTARGGTTFQASDTDPDPLSSALKVSASRDLPCESAGLELERLDPEREYAVTGCGFRVLYRARTPTLRSKRIELVSRAPTSSGHAVALLSPSTTR
jgi:hypothetical protein